jgi:hypothetical protein
MCTMISEQVKIEGTGKGTGGWFKLNKAYVSYDHPFNAPMEHALNLDFVNESLGLDARVAVEISAAAAKSLIETINQVLEQAETRGHIT